MGIAAFVQANGIVEASRLWNEARTEQERYELIRPYLSFAPKEFITYQPDQYKIVLNERLYSIEHADLFVGANRIAYEDQD